MAFKENKMAVIVIADLRSSMTCIPPIPWLCHGNPEHRPGKSTRDT
ncbi:hypothetical protein HYALB_00009446 [Hymenoscyphus albidus]|uniref:Uncharacterized protein n=1 Tax=Hymenoscyphus albidus TaxID=595503 RepID=A0A9N9Q3S4_9HELO|nr:hypothetical protein HYALB_00009446 [Hymenoscyphus albidus]